MKRTETNPGLEQEVGYEAPAEQSTPDFVRFADLTSDEKSAIVKKRYDADPVTRPQADKYLFEQIDVNSFGMGYSPERAIERAMESFSAKVIPTRTDDPESRKQVLSELSVDRSFYIGRFESKDIRETLRRGADQENSGTAFNLVGYGVLERKVPTDDGFESWAILCDPNLGNSNPQLINLESELAIEGTYMFTSEA